MKGAVVLVLVNATAAPASAQIPDRVPAQQAGATDWFGDRMLRVRGGTRVEIQPRQEGYVAIIQLVAGKPGLVRRVAQVAAQRVAIDVPTLFDADPGTGGRVPFVVTAMEPSGRPTGAPPAPASVPRGPSRLADGVMVLITDVALDSADLERKLMVLPGIPADSVASHVGQLLVGNHTSMWAAYYSPR